MKDTLDGTDISSILNNLISRKRFITNWKTIINVMFKCVCRRRAHSKSDELYLFEQGEKKLRRELDVISLLKAIRRIKLLT